MSFKALILIESEVVSLSSSMLLMWITASPSWLSLSLDFLDVWQTVPQGVPSEVRIGAP
ncbi:MAG: hypothetical protein HOJ88_05660 [Proteobacteria bacterium]|nr:hypothetical protein [Pseudomonadota bacterium]